MFSKKHRLAKNKEVKMAFARGRSFFNRLFTVKFLKTSGAAQRFTVVISTKVSKKAVVRNRIKRVLREFIRLRMPDFVPGDYAVVVKPSASSIEEKLLLQEFDKLLKSSKLLR